MRLLIQEHLLLMTWLLWLQACHDAGSQTVCSRNEIRCRVKEDQDPTSIHSMNCSGYGAVAQLPPACTETRVIKHLAIRHNTTVDTLQHRILDGLQMSNLELIGLGIRNVVVTAFEAISGHLETLHLQDNQLESLPVGVFRTLRHLTRLQLYNNRLPQLSEGTFEGLTNLVYLTLSANRISAVEERTWFKMPALVTLSLENNLLGSGQLMFPYRSLEHLEELRLASNRLSEIDYRVFSGVPNLRKLDLRSNGLESLPHGIFRAAPLLGELDVSSNNINQLTRDSFNGSTALTVLLLDGNPIQQLQENLFEHLKTLHILRMRQNMISDVPLNSLVGLQELRQLDLTGNRIPTLPLGMFDPLGHLTQLWLGSNVIRRVAKKPFKSCLDLQTLDMTNNLLSVISADWFVHTTRLTSVKLANNRIESIEARAFDQLQQLTELDLSDNYLSDLGNDSFVNLRSLQKLNLARNPLRHLASPGTTFSGLPALKHLDLTECCITELVLNSSAPLPALTELYLGDNLLTNISRHTLAATTSLQKLELGYNIISAIETGALSSLSSLNWLNLSRNLLTEDQLAVALQTVPSDIVVDASWNRLKSLTSLTVPLAGIYLSGNSLVCSCSPPWISLEDTGRFLDARQTLCTSGSESMYLLCYWSRYCSSQAEHQLCSESIPTRTNSLATSPSKVCRLDAAMTVFGPRFVDFDVHALSPTSAQLSWNVSDELSTMAGYQFTFTLVYNCTNGSATILYARNETTYTTIRDNDVNLTSIEIGNLTSGEMYVACADVLQTPRGSSNETVSDSECACLELPTETTTPLPSTTQKPTTTKVETTTSATTTTTTSLPTTTTLTTTTTRTTTVSTTTTATTTTTTTTTTPPPTTTTTRPTTTKTTKMTVVETSARASAIETTTDSVKTMTPVYRPPVDILIWARSNETAIFVTWVTVNSTERFPYFWLVCFDDAKSKVASVGVSGYSYVIGNLLQDSAYNICVTAITHRSFKDPTHCVLVHTDKASPDDSVSPPRKDMGNLFLIVVIAVPIACLLLVLLIICIVIAVSYRRRRRRQNKPAETEMTSSSTCDSSTGNGGQPISCAINSPSSEQPVTRLNVYDEVAAVPSAPPSPEDETNHLYWNNLRDPLPLHSTLSLNIYNNALSY